MKRTELKRKKPLRRVAKWASTRTCCGKRAYRSEVAAAAALSRIQQEASADRKPRRVYQCKEGAWHLTSEPRRAPDGTDKQRAYRLVMERDGNACILSGATRHLDIHHRKLRGVGGSLLLDVPENLVTLSRADHEWVHQNPDAARDMGLIVSRYEDPALIPVVHWELGVVRLTRSGEYELVDGGDAA